MESRGFEKSYYIIFSGDIKKALDENGLTNNIILTDQLALLYTDNNFDSNILNSIDEIGWWQLSTPMSSMVELNKDNLEIGQSPRSASGAVYIDKNPYINTSGKGIIVGIIDSGIDYLNEDFINEDRTSSIISIWDQEKESGRSPEGLLFGSEISREEINNAINNKDDSLTKDVKGTGTLIAGIIGGKGKNNKSYKGVAPNVEFIVVKLRSYIGTYEKNSYNYQVSDFLAAIKYILNASKDMEKPIVINISIGTRSGAVIDTNVLDSFGLINERGVVVVSGAGNEGNTDIHYSGILKEAGNKQDISIQIGNQKSIDITLCCRKPDKIGAILISPAGEMSVPVMYAPDKSVYKGSYNLEGVEYEMQLYYPWIVVGNEVLNIRLNNVKPGVWILRLVGELIVDGLFDVYLPNKNIIAEETRFIDPDSMSTITLYAEDPRVLTIGAYNNKTDSMWIGSSKGPVRSKPIKPDIVAPGVDIIGAYIKNSYISSTGTGVSGAIISGVTALLMEYLIKQDSIGSALYTETIKTYLMLGSTQKEIYKYPNESQGYGILNLEQTLKEISKNL